MFVVGFDVGGTNVRGVGLHPGSIEPLAIRRGLTTPNGDAIVATIVDVAQGLAVDTGEDIAAVGLGVAALIDSAGTFRYAPNIPGVLDYPLVSKVQDALGVPTIADNDATTATWGEWRHGAGVGSADMAFVALGTGIGTGFVLDGRLHRGAHGYAGEAGHMTIQRDGPEHVTGARGPWEYYASGTGLGRLARQWASEGRVDGLIERAGSVSDIRGEHVTEALSDGDATMAQLIERFADDVAIGMVDLVYVLDPEVMVLGGGLVALGEVLRGNVEQRLAERLLGAAHRPSVPVRLAQLGSFAGAIGAADLAAQQLQP